MMNFGGIFGAIGVISATQIKNSHIENNTQDDYKKLSRLQKVVLWLIVVGFCLILASIICYLFYIMFFSCDLEVMFN